MENSTPHILDLVFSNKKDFVEDLQYLPGLGLSDHVCLEFSFKCYTEYNPVSKPKYNLYSADFLEMSQLILMLTGKTFLILLMLGTTFLLFSTKQSLRVYCWTCCVPEKIFIYYTKLSASKIRNANSGINTSPLGPYLSLILAVKLLY